MKVFVNSPGEDWICDRLASEWYECNGDISTPRFRDADVVWFLSGWTWNHYPYSELEQRKVLTTVHHIDLGKFDARKRADFNARDRITTAYHVPCQRTADVVKELTDKPIHVISYWANQLLWRPRQANESLGMMKEKHGLDENAFVIGSFQRDTEGSDPTVGKWEKGPDLFVDAVVRMSKKLVLPIQVVLAGWRREYVMNGLRKHGIKFKYFERPSVEIVRELYLALDLYLVTSRVEGGPQAIIECAAMHVPIVSTPVGIADNILSPCAIGQDVTVLEPDPETSYANVQKLFLPQGHVGYRNLLGSL